MQQKYPIINTTLLSLSSIDPCALGHTATQKYLKKLGNLFPQILESDELVDGYVTDISKINLDKELPPAMITKDDESVCPVELDDWWNRAIFVTGKYPVLTLVGKACLLIFSGPLVKGSFSIMNDIMNDKRSKMVTETYDGIMNVKLNQLALEESSTKPFSHSDPIYSPVNRKICRAMHSAALRSTQAKKKRSKIAKKPWYYSDLRPSKACRVPSH